MQQTALQIVLKLQQAGFLAYFAGGCVRDMLMEHPPADFDIATSARPEEIEALLAKTIPIGKKFGVILALENSHSFEIATFRSDSGYTDGRRPNAVYFSSPREDALRRDFTINGMFYDPVTKEFLDFVDGQKDLQNKNLRFIGDPIQRIQEDKLRILRAVRFKNRFNFAFDVKTQAALHAMAAEVTAVSRERIGDEFNKILLDASRVAALKDLDQFGVLNALLPELEALKYIPQPDQYHQEGDVFTHTLMVLEQLAPQTTDLALIWAALLHDTGKRETFQRKADRIHFDGHAQKSAEIAEEVSRRFRFNNVLRQKIKWLAESHMQIGQIVEMRLAHKVKLFLHPWFEDLMELHRADESGSQPVDLSLYREIMREYAEFKNEKLLTTPLKPLLTGAEIMAKFNLKASPQIGELLEALHNAQIEDRVTNKKEAYAFVEGEIGGSGGI